MKFLCKNEKHFKIKKRLSILIMIMIVFGINTKVWSQEKQLNLNLQNTSIVQVLKLLHTQTKLKFVYNDDNLANYRVTINVKNKSLKEVMDLIIKDKPLNYEITKEHVIIFIDDKKDEKINSIKITGTVVDNKGLSLPGVTVVIKGTSIGTATDVNGKFGIQVAFQNAQDTLQFSFIGMKTKYLTINQHETNYNVVLLDDVAELEDVVVTGYFQRKKTSITGAEINVTGKDLRRLGSLNMLQAISVFDPSVRTVTNNEYGSDPNKVPEITIRGENGFDLRGSADDSQSNPNAPLYIMDGIEVSATSVYDMDMNRIASFSILKDASATSLYGARGANGVILITTVRPKVGELKVSLSTNFNISVPDLSDYNLMNSSEKLEYERLANVYTDKTHSKEKQMELDILYNDRLGEVVRGVNTYWLSQPLRTSLNQRYNAFIEGGDRAFRYGVTLQYNSDCGVMKGSSRDKYGINVNLNYTIESKLIIRNDLAVNNLLANNSPYGSFSVYAKQNPYERIYNAETGEMTRRFESNNQKNPLLDAYLSSKDEEKYLEFRDNLFVEYRPNTHLRFAGRISLTKKESKKDKFSSPNSVAFDKEEDANKKGSYTVYNSEDTSLDGNITASYNNTFYEKFIVSVGLGSNLTTSKIDASGFTAYGFLNDKMSYVQYAQQFLENSKPSGNYDNSRMVGFFGNVNLGWDNRYFIDASFRTDASSRFGRNSRFAPFWSLGFAWNVDKESFWNMAGSMKVRASVGSTGTTNFSSDQAITKYNYNSDSEYNGVYGAVLSQFGNPNLKWQSTLQYNAGIDLNILNGFLTFNIDAYLNRTQNLLLDIDIAPSTGFNSYKENMGTMDNKGIDLRMRLNLIRNRAKDLNWSVTLGLSHNKNVIKKLSNAMKKMNEESLTLENSSGIKTYRVYKEGRSQSALMVVKSLGIDPMTGNEIFQTLNGDLSYDYNPNDKIEVGDMNPKIQGNLQSNLTYKGFNLYCVLRYELGAKIYNQTLASKVEGASPLNNADKRVLYDRWKKPGDIAMFRRIDDNSPVYQSSRLVQKNDFLSLSNLSLSYEIPRGKLENIFLERCKFTLSTTDLFRISTVKEERGTSYPFARTYTLGLNITF